MRFQLWSAPQLSTFCEPLRFELNATISPLLVSTLPSRISAWVALTLSGLPVSMVTAVISPLESIVTLSQYSRVPVPGSDSSFSVWSGSSSPPPVIVGMIVPTVPCRTQSVVISSSTNWKAWMPKFSELLTPGLDSFDLEILSIIASPE